MVCLPVWIDFDSEVVVVENWESQHKLMLADQWHEMLVQIWKLQFKLFNLQSILT